MYEGLIMNNISFFGEWEGFQRYARNTKFKNPTQIMLIRNDEER